MTIALEGNIDQVQYTDRIKSIVEFLGPRLSLEELTKMWNLQVRAGQQNLELKQEFSKLKNLKKIHY